VHHSKSDTAMTALGHVQTCPFQEGMSALPLKADIIGRGRDVRYGPKQTSSALGRIFSNECYRATMMKMKTGAQMTAKAFFDGVPVPPCGLLLGWHVLEVRPEEGWIRIGLT
jgi:hypothetical protein